MQKASIKEVAKMMRNLDMCMMVTTDGRNTFQSRPMSNNGKVDYEGNSWFFSFLDSGKVRQIENHPMVSLIFQTDRMVFVDCYGKATITTDVDLLKEKWVKGLEMWFKDGPETAGICLIKVNAHRVRFWSKDEEGEYQAD